MNLVRFYELSNSAENKNIGIGFNPSALAHGIDEDVIDFFANQTPPPHVEYVDPHIDSDCAQVLTVTPTPNKLTLAALTQQLETRATIRSYLEK